MATTKQAVRLQTKKAVAATATTGRTSAAKRKKRGIPSFQEIVRSPAFQSATKKAAQVARDPKKATKLAQQALKKASRKKKGPLGPVLDDLKTLIRLIEAYAKGEYRRVPWQTMVIVIAVVIYFVSPADVVPEGVLPGIGYIDDVLLVVEVVRSIKGDLDSFREWEAAQNAK